VLERAIGIFDSGVGGLTVLKALLQVLPGEQLFYLGDTARVPYGTKSPGTVLRYAQEAAEFLVQQRVKMLVVACNTASAVAVDVLEQRFSLPVVGVIEPGARKAAFVTKNRRVGVIGTEGTIRSGAYSRAICAVDAEIEVFSAACPLFVPLVEEGWAEHKVATLAAREYLAPLIAQNIDTLVLGCTHYPLLKKTLQRILGPQVQLIDSAAETAHLVAGLLGERNVLRSSDALPHRYFVTDESTRFKRVGGAFVGAELHDVTQIDLESEREQKAR